MDKAGLFDHIAEVGRNSQPGLEGAPMTRVLVIAEFLLPEHGPGGRPQKALLRMSSEADGNPVIRWDARGMLEESIDAARQQGHLGFDT